MAFLRDGEEFLNKPIFGGQKSGLLVVQDFEDDRNVAKLEEQKGPIRILEASKLEDSIDLDFDERPEGVEELNDADAVIYRTDEENSLYAVSSSMGDVLL